MDLLTNAPLPRAVPAEYVLPPDKRPGGGGATDDDPSSGAAAVVSLPVVDLRGPDAVRDIIAAGREFGFFHVTNHGVSDSAVRAFRAAAAGFFALPPEAKRPYRSDDQGRAFRVASSTGYDGGGTRYWRDYIKLRHCRVPFPTVEGEGGDDVPSQWPETFRSTLPDYIAQVQALASTLLELIARGLGLDGGFFSGDLSGGETQMNVNYYPPCPDPSLTLGLLPHCDRHLLTLLSQGDDPDVPGLQARYRGRWVPVRPVPGAFVVNFGHQMEILTNGLLRSVEHRAVTNPARPRMSVATLVAPAADCRVAPAPELLLRNGDPPRFRAFRYGEFLEAYADAAASREDVLERFRIPV